MKVLLVDPPFYRLIGFYNRYFPLSLVNVGTVLKKAGHEVVVYDADTNENPCAMDYTRLPDHYRRYLASFQETDHPVWQEVRRTIQQSRPEVIGISLWTTYAAAAFHVARISKEINPVCPVLMGGPHATVKAEEVLSICRDVDYVIRGEGEATAVELIEAISNGGLKKACTANPHSALRTPQLEAIRGLSFRADGVIKHNPARERIRNLDDLPVPDRSLLKNEKTYSSEDMGLVMTSRGCPFSCSFCATDTRQVRYRSIKHVFAEVRDVKSTYGTTQFSFKDDSFTVNKKRVAEFCGALTRENLHIGWECNTRVDLVNEDMLRDMKRAGCNSIKVGIESGSEAELARMNKGITLAQARRAAALFRRIGIHWTGYFLMGTPGESVEDIYKTLDFMYEIRPDFASMGVYEPFPGSPLFEEGIRLGLTRSGMAMADFYTMLPNHYYKVDPRRQVETIEPEQFVLLEREMKERFHKYNRHYTRILNRARARMTQYLQSPRMLYADFQKYLSWR